MSKVWAVCTATLASQTATFTPKAGIEKDPPALQITGATVTVAANAATEYNTSDEYIVTIERRLKT
jgi:hypothetical protein